MGRPGLAWAVIGPQAAQGPLLSHFLLFTAAQWAVQGIFWALNNLFFMGARVRIDTASWHRYLALENDAFPKIDLSERSLELFTKKRLGRSKLSLVLWSAAWNSTLLL